METVLQRLEEALSSSLAVVSIPRTGSPICGAPDDVRNYLEYAEKVVGQLTPPPTSTETFERHDISLEVIRQKVLRKPKAFHVPMTNDDSSPLCKGQFNVSIRPKRLRRKTYLIDTTDIFNFVFTDGSGIAFREASINGKITKIKIVVPSSNTNQGTIKIAAIFPMSVPNVSVANWNNTSQNVNGDARHTVFIETISMEEAFNSLFTESRRQSYLSVSQDPENSLELFGANPGIIAIIWHSVICHSMAVEARWQYGILNGVKTIRIAFSKYNAELYFSRDDTSSVHGHLSKYKTFSNALKRSLRRSVKEIQVQLFSKEGDTTMDLSAISNEFHGKVPATDNGDDESSSWHILNIIELIIRECEDVAIGIPGLSKKSVMLRRRRPNEPKIEKIKEAAKVLEAIKYHKEGGFIYRHWSVRLIAILWILFSFTLGVLAAVFNWGHRTSALEKIYDFLSIVTFLSFTFFAFVRFRMDGIDSTLHHALRGIKVLRNSMDVEEYYREKLQEICPASDGNACTGQSGNVGVSTGTGAGQSGNVSIPVGTGTGQSGNGGVPMGTGTGQNGNVGNTTETVVSPASEETQNMPQDTDHGHDHSEALNIPFEVALCATQKKLQWMDGSHACYLDQTPTGNIVFKRGIYVPRLKMYGVLVDKQATLHYTKGKSTLNSANDYSMVVHMDRQLTVSDLFMQGEIIIYSKERAGRTYNLV